VPLNVKKTALSPDRKQKGEENDEKWMAKDCPYFTPHLIDSCSNCKQSINQPEYTWQLWVSGYFDKLPVCSEKCRTELQIKCDKEIAEMRAGEAND
jgi:hypothetical protein